MQKFAMVSAVFALAVMMSGVAGAASELEERLSKGELTEGMNLPKFTDGKPFPTPQQAEYADGFAAVKSVKIALSGLKADDARVKLLISKLARVGIKAEVGDAAGAYAVQLALDAAVPVDKPEGYSLVTTKDGAEIRARDAQGVLWGVVSFLQMIDPEKKSILLAKISDWPDVARRGFIGNAWKGCLEFALFQKMNVVVIGFGLLNSGDLSEKNLQLAGAVAQQFRAFGLELYYRTDWVASGLKAPRSEPQYMEKLTATFQALATAGAGVYYSYERERYPIDKLDQERGRNGSDIDAKLLAQAFTATKAAHPDFRLIFCPPFYFGPEGATNLPDDREKYLRSLRELPTEVEVCWAGPKMRAFYKTPEQVKWFTDLTGRKPAIFQNGTGTHNLLSYIVDDWDWDLWHYDGFCTKDITCFLKNAGLPNDCTVVAPLADYLWNLKGYDCHRAAERGAGQLLGKDAYRILRPGADALAYFDKYRRGILNPEILRENQDDLKAKYAFVKQCWEKAIAYNPEVALFSTYNTGMIKAKKVLDTMANPPNFAAKLKKDVDAARELAVKETAFDAAKGELLFLPTDISGSEMLVYNNPIVKEPGRFAKFLRGKDTVKNAAEFDFPCATVPANGCELWIRGMDDDVPGENPIAIEVNGQVIHSGASGFVSNEYRLAKFKVPAAALKNQNHVKIANLARGAMSDEAPFVAICYIAVKP